MNTSYKHKIRDVCAGMNKFRVCVCVFVCDKKAKQKVGWWPHFYKLMSVMIVFVLSLLSQMLANNKEGKRGKNSQRKSCISGNKQNFFSQQCLKTNCNGTTKISTYLASLLHFRLSNAFIAAGIMILVRTYMLQCVCYKCVVFLHFPLAHVENERTMSRICLQALD